VIAIAAAVALWVIGEGPSARIGALLIGAVAVGLALPTIGSRGRRWPTMSVASWRSGRRRSGGRCRAMWRGWWWRRWRG